MGWLVREGTTNQVRPRSWVPPITPPSPTTQPSRVPANATPLRVNAVASLVSLQCAPRSKVRRIVPFEPTTQPVSRAANVTSISTSPAFTFESRVHRVPPLRVVSTVPPAPTAHPSRSLVNHTPCKLKAVWLACISQEAPAFAVLRIVPPSPTAHPVAPSGRNDTPNRSAPLALLGWTNQPVSGNTVTRAVSLRPPAVTNSEAVPSPTPKTRPSRSTRNTPGLPLTQPKDTPLTALPSMS